MAKTFTTGTINAANAGAVGAAMFDQIRDDLVAHAAWDLVEEFIPASIMKWRVFKCLAAQSGLPVDFYVTFGLTIATGEIRAAIHEGYNAGTHTMSLYSQNSGSRSSSTLLAYDASGRQTTHTFVLSTSPWGGSLPGPRPVHWLPNSVSTKWWIIVDSDMLYIAFNGAVNAWMGFGAYDWLGSIANACPLMHCGSTGGFYTGITRNPACISGNFGHYATTCLISPGGGVGAPNTGILGFPMRLDFNDKLVNDKRAVCELGILLDNEFSVAHVNSSENIGTVLGKLKGLRYGVNPPGGVAFGDAYAHNGTLWVPWLPTDGRIFDTGVAV